MKALCSNCKNEYEEIDLENFIFIESGCLMICYECIDKQNREFEERMNNQPERSKREDDIMYLKCAGCGEYKHIFADREHMDRCGALNSMET